MSLELPDPIKREKAQTQEANEPIDPMNYALNCLGTLANAVQAIGIVYASVHKESLEEQDAEKIKTLLNMD